MLISIYRVCCWKGQKVNKNSIQSIIPQKLTETFGNWSPPIPNSGAMEPASSSRLRRSLRPGLVRPQARLRWSSPRKTAAPPFCLSLLPGSSRVLHATAATSSAGWWVAREGSASSRGGKYFWREIIGNLTVFIVLLWLLLFLFSSDNVISAVKWTCYSEAKFWTSGGRGTTCVGHRAPGSLLLCCCNLPL